MRKEFILEFGSVTLDNDVKPEVAVLASVAISLKRIADMMENNNKNVVGSLSRESKWNNGR